MLFHSPEFIFGFLPVCLAVFAMARHFWGWSGALAWLVIASLYFYGQWSLSLVALLAASILANYGTARLILARIEQRSLAARILIVGVAGNLALLGYFKYTNFFIDNLNMMTGSSWSHANIILPVGISFYTFIQIGFLVEVYNRQVTKLKLSNYVLFASFFPCVTAGPIILQKDVMPQLEDGDGRNLDAARLAIGLSVFAIGLFKKLVLADNIAPFADLVFDGVAGGAQVGATTAWLGAFAYTLQLYFDFSGYSDMALGLGYLFGINLPLNFNSPLKACSITDFWRRWHMTMTRFFTNYVYSPIAMTAMRHAMRHGYGRGTRFLAVTALPVTATFVLAGLWHGAGWTFVVFGLIHGVALAVNHGWREAGLPPLPRLAAWPLTMAVVVTGLVVFRAADIPVALSLLASMLGFGTIATGGEIAAAVTIDVAAALPWIVALGAIAMTCPNVQEIMRDHWFSSDPPPADQSAWPAWLAWRPSPAWGIAGAILVAAALGSITSDTAFLYYQF